MMMMTMIMLMTMMMMMNVYETKHRIINIIILTVSMGHKKECGQHSPVVAFLPCHPLNPKQCKRRVCTSSSLQRKGDCRPRWTLLEACSGMDPVAGPLKP